MSILAVKPVRKLIRILFWRWPTAYVGIVAEMCSVSAKQFTPSSANIPTECAAIAWQLHWYPKHTYYCIASTRRA